VVNSRSVCGAAAALSSELLMLEAMQGELSEKETVHSTPQSELSLSAIA
jgi:hypothetical protein